MLDGFDDDDNDESADMGSRAAVLSAIIQMHNIPNEMYALDDIFVKICIEIHILKQKGGEKNEKKYIFNEGSHNFKFN